MDMLAKNIARQLLHARRHVILLIEAGEEDLQAFSKMADHDLQVGVPLEHPRHHEPQNVDGRVSVPSPA